MAEDRDAAYDSSQEVDNPLRERTRIRVPLVTLDVRLTPRVGIQAALTVPDVTRTAIVQRAAGPVHFKENFSGIGDTSLLGWYRLNPRRRWYPVLNVGVSLPTGKTETPRFRQELEDGSLVPMSRLQRGSGTADPVLGASLTRSREPWTVFASVAARVPFYANRHGLRTGASSELNVGGARSAGTHRVSLFGRVGWLHRKQDVFEGTPVLVGGGDWLYAATGVGVLVAPLLNVQAEVKVPLYRSLDNRQLDSSAVFQVGISRSF